MERVDLAIIGAGVTGLAVAARAARSGGTVVVLERNASFGRETSSRSSEVIHAGLYYPPGSLKARLCLRGRRLLYEYCERRGIPHRRIGKLIVAATRDEAERLEALAANAFANGVEDLERVGRDGVKRLEPAVEAAEGLFSPDTGIVDSHALMDSLYRDALAGQAFFLFGTGVTRIERSAGGFRVFVNGNDRPELEAGILANAAGLDAGKAAALAGLDEDADGCRIHLCKGSYFRPRVRPPVSRLVYPLPGDRGLGIHLTIDLAGGVRFGPDARYVEEVDYAVDPSLRGDFAVSARRYLPGIAADDLLPDTAGIRPMLQGPGDGFRDFLIREESPRGLPGLVTLAGIDSPGLTASLAVAEHVEPLLR